MSVRAKFRCIERKETAAWGNGGKNQEAVVLQPVSGDAPENKTWSQYTPSGRLEMVITNPAALDQFIVGDEYFLDISPAKPAE